MVKMPTQSTQKIRSRTTPLGKRGQIVGHASLIGKNRMPLKTISTLGNAPISTCSDIIRRSKQRWAGNPDAPDDPCADENIKPNPMCKKGDNQILSHAQKQFIISFVLSNAAYCRNALNELLAESQLQISTSTLHDVLAADGIQHHSVNMKPYLKDHQKQAWL